MPQNVAGLLLRFTTATAWLAVWGSAVSVDSCPGYKAVNVATTSHGLKADLVLAGAACNVFGNDIQRLSLSVVYEDVSRIHLKIIDPTSSRYEVPESVLPRPTSQNVDSSKAAIEFQHVNNPFSFKIVRRSNGDVLFDTTNNPLVFEPQYLRLKTNLPLNANLYGLGEHTETFRLPTVNLTRTLWSRDAFGIPTGTNLYGNHPIYFEHRSTGTHGVFLLNSNGMDIKVDSGAKSSSLEYNVIGGVLDLYFLAGSETSPVEVAKQYAQVVGTPAEVPYWSFGLHQCRFGYKDFVDVAGVISNYSAAGIPLETMWTDIDYMDNRKIFTNDPQYFPTDKLREIVSFLHEHDQHYIMMVDPAVAYVPDTGYQTLDHGLSDDVFLKNPNGSLHLGVVWPGVTVYPDWFHPNVTSFWNSEFERYFDPGTGIDIDGVWIDMNEPASFCAYPCTDPFDQARQQGLPPVRTSPPPNPDTPIFQTAPNVQKRAEPTDEQLLNPPYNIQNAAGVLSDRTAHVDVVHHNGLKEYDTHNLFGTMMSVATRDAMLNRRPGKRTLVITRSTFSGAGHHVGKWLGDNLSLWEHYRFSIAGMLGMATVYQIPMVGSDVCGFGDNTTDTLCARWAMLGAFYPFYRNHNQDTSISQEFYRWPIVAQAAKNAIDARYRLLDYIYTAFHKSNTDGTPVLNPLWFKYPNDQATFPIDLQFLYGESVLVSPVTEENVTTVDIYLPKDIFYDFQTFAPVQGHGSTVTLTNISFSEIPLHIVGGTVLPLRSHSANTTTLLRQQPFDFVVAPNSAGHATGSLYIDDGVSINQPKQTLATMNLADGKLTVGGQFGFSDPVPQVESVTFLNVGSNPRRVVVNGKQVSASSVKFDSKTKSLVVGVKLPLNKGFTVQMG